MDIDKLEALVKKVAGQMESVGIPISKDIESVTINNRAKKRLGACLRRKSFTGKYIYTIEISRYTFNCGEKELCSIIAHELLHTCKGCFNHGEEWKIMGKLVEDKLGYPISRTVNYKELGIAEPEGRAQVKYVIICEKCGQKIERKRMCNLVKNIEKYRCGKCGGTLEFDRKSTISCR